jgi:oligosaccharide reducing-end xylanase
MKNILFFIVIAACLYPGSACPAVERSRNAGGARAPMVPWEKGAWETGKYRNVFLEAGYSKEAIDAKLGRAYADVFEGPRRVYFEVGDSMAYISDVKNKDIRTEGMSYGLMVAIQMNKKDVFDRLWRWSKRYLQHQGGSRDAYFGWNADPATFKRNSDGSASDGELYYITALLFASNRWGDSTGIDYHGEARRILDAMWSKDGTDGVMNLLNVEHKQITFTPDRWGMQWTDPSYHLPAFFEIWAEYGGDGRAQFYRDCADTARAFLRRACAAATGLNADATDFSGKPRSVFRAAAFRFDSWRVPMNIAMDYAWFARDREWQRDYARRLQGFLAGRGIDAFEDQFNLDGTLPEWVLPAGGVKKLRHSIGLVSTAAAASLMASGGTGWQFVDAVWNAKLEPYDDGYYDGYYDGLLYLFSLMHLSGNYRIIKPGR